jgi:hypothetical protein
MARQLAYYRATPEEIAEARKRGSMVWPASPPGRDVTAEYEAYLETPEGQAETAEAAAEFEAAGLGPAPEGFDEDFDPEPITQSDPNIRPVEPRLGWAEELLRQRPRESQSPAEAPAAVDQKAASVAERQKGTPTAQADLSAEMQWAEAFRQEASQRVLGGQHGLENKALHDKATETLSSTLDPQEGFSRDERAARARAAYGEDTGPSTRWEDEFNAGQNDAERRANLVRNLSLLTGDVNSSNVAYDRVMQQHALRQEGLAKARERDRQNSRISRGLAEAIAATGQVSPEEAVNLTYADPLVKAFSSGMYSQGGRAEGQALGREKMVANAALELLKTGVINRRQYDQMVLNAATQTTVAAMNDQPVNRVPTQAEMETMGSLMGQALEALGPVSADTGIRAMQGDLRGLNEEQRAKAESLRPQIMAKAMGKGGLDKVLNDSLTTQITQPVKDQYSIQKSLDIARNKPAERVKFKNDWDAAKSQFTAAYQAWGSLNESERKLFAQWAGQGWTKDFRAAYNELFGTTPTAEMVNKFSAVQGAINALVKERSGSAVTGSEWERIAAELGIEADNWGPFNSSGAITSWLKRSGDLLIQHRRNFESEYAGWETGYVR